MHVLYQSQTLSTGCIMDRIDTDQKSKVSSVFQKPLWLAVYFLAMLLNWLSYVYVLSLTLH